MVGPLRWIRPTHCPDRVTYTDTDAPQTLLRHGPKQTHLEDRRLVLPVHLDQLRAEEALDAARCRQLLQGVWMGMGWMWVCNQGGLAWVWR